MSINSLTSYNPLSINGLDTVNINGNPFDPTTLVPYVLASSTVNLNSQNIKTTYAPIASSDLTNKTYVDAQDALRASLTGNNTFSGTNTFNNTLTTGVGYTSNLNRIIQTIQTPSGQSAGNFTTSLLPSGVPVGSVLSGSYTLTAGVSSGAMGMWLGAYAYTSSQNSFSFSGMSGSQTLALYVYQYNTAGTLAVQISDSVYTITTSSATVSGSFLANKFSTYTGKIVFYFQASAVNQSVSFSGFFHDIGSVNINGSLSITGIATETPITTIGLNSSNQLIKYANPVSSVFTGSVSSTYIPYASSANVFANSIMYQSGTQINIGGTLSTTGNITSSGDMSCGIISPSSGYGRLDDRSLRPKDINPATEQFFFASWNNDGGAPFADAIGMNGWTDSTGGLTNCLMVRKDTYGIRQYQGTFGSTTAFVNSPAGSAQYMDVCMKGVGDNTKTIFQPIGGTWNAPLTVGSGTDSGGAQLITTNGNLHLDGRNSYDIYYGYYAYIHGTPNTHRWFGGTYIFNQLPQSGGEYAHVCTLNGENMVRSQAVAHQVVVYASNSWAGGTNLVNSFYRYNGWTSQLIIGRLSYYVSSATMAYPTIRIYSQTSGQYWYFQTNNYTNVVSNHITVPIYVLFSGGYTNATGWFDIYVYNNGNCITDGGDILDIHVITLPASQY